MNAAIVVVLVGQFSFWMGLILGWCFHRSRHPSTETSEEPSGG